MKKELAEKFPFPYGLFYEDLATIPMIVASAEKISYVEKSYYHYRQREGSIIYTFSSKTLDVFKGFDRVFHFYEEKGIFETYYEELEAMAIEHLMLYANRRFVHADQCGEYLKKSRDRMQSWFPNWKKNRKLKQMSLNDRMFVLIAATANVRLLKGLLALKQKARGKSR